MKPYLAVILTVVAFAVMIFAPLIAHHAAAFAKDVVANVKDKTQVAGLRLKQSGFVLLLRAYGGYPSGQIVELPKSTEDSLVAAGIASTSAGPATAGNVSTNQPGGAVSIAAAASSVTIINSSITAQSLVWAQVSQAAADGTLLYIARVVPAAGSVTIYGNAAATAVVNVDWAILSPYGNLTTPT